MNRIMLISVSALAATALAQGVGCSSDDDDGTGGGTTSNTTSNGGGTTSNTGTGGAGCGCWSCGEYILECMNDCPAGDPTEVVCPDSLPLMLDLNECICDAARGNCGSVCPVTCALGVGGGGQGGAGQGGEGTDCVACQGTAVQATCNPEMTACSAETGCTG